MVLRQLYKDDPTAPRRTALRQRFDRIFTRVTGFGELDKAVARTHANKDELLLVLDRPDIPLHTNGSENAASSPNAGSLVRPAPPPASRRAIPSSAC